MSSTLWSIIRPNTEFNISMTFRTKNVLRRKKEKEGLKAKEGERSLYEVTSKKSELNP